MKKFFFLFPALMLSLVLNAAHPTITIDGDKSDWAEVPMLSEPGTWPMLKVLPAADAELGTNALVYMMENTADFDPTWSQYPKAFIDKDYDGTTHTIDSYWAFDAMGLEYSATTGVDAGGWVSFPKAISADNKVFELGFPATYITDLGSKFSFAMYYNDGTWFCPDRSEPAVQSFSPANGFLYKTRSYTTVAGTTTLTTDNVYAHPSMGEVDEYVDFGLRDNGYDTIRWVAFPIELTAPAVYELTTNVTTTNAWKFEFWLVDVETNAVVAHIDPPASSLSSSATSHNFGAWDLTAIPSGKYMLKVKNRTAFSKVKLNSIVLEYKGGAPVAIPGTLSFDDVILSDEAWIDKSGEVDSLLFTARGSEGHNSVNYAKWKVQVTQAGAYDFTANVYRPDGSQRYEIKVLNLDESSELISNSLTGMPTGNASISSGCVYLEEGVYTVKIRNTYDYAKSRLLSVVATCIGGAVQNMPGTTNINDAWFSDGGTRADGKISFPGSQIATSWVRWNVHFATGGYYNVKVNVNASNGHNYGVRLSNSEQNISITEGGQNENPTPLVLGEVFIPAGDYTLEVTNPVSHSNAQLISVLIETASSSSTTLPTTLNFADADLSEKAHITDGELWFNTIGDSNPVGQWARWEVVVDHIGTYLFTMAVSSTNGQSYRITILDSGNNEVAVYDKNPGGSGDKTISHYFYLEDGNYFVKVENTYAWSQGHIVSLVVTEPTILSLDQAATDNSVLTTNERDEAQPIQIIRTIVAGMYNTISLPFDVSSSQLPEVFGSDVELKQLGSTAFDEEASILDLNFEDVTSIHRGTPYMIKTSKDIVNPVFDGAIIKARAGDQTSATHVDFVGTLTSTKIPAGENNLFLGPNNLLYFSPDAATPVKGFRAWFVVHDIPNPAHVIKRARIVQGEQILTAIDLVNGENNNSRKIIENGQLIIIRDGVRYNVMGVKVE